MARGRQQAAWAHTATIVAMLANQVRDEKKRRQPFEPHEFMPSFAKPPREKPTGTVNIRDLKGLFTKPGLSAPPSKKGTRR